MFTKRSLPPFLLRGSVLCGVALLGVACGGAGEDDPAASAGNSAASDPLLAGILDGRTFEEAEFEVEQRVQECMTALGWEYTAVAPGSTGGGQLGTADTFDADAFAAESGYGISTSPQGGDVTGGAVQATGLDAGSDPNTNYTNTLSPEEQSAYFEDLYGPPVDVAATDATDDAAAVTPGGCYGEASDAVYGKGAFEQLNDQFEEVDARMQDDPRLVEAFDAWAACMAEDGYEYSSPNDPYEDFSSRMSALGDQPDAAALAALQEEEIATAKADRACAKEADLDTIQQDVFEDISAQVASGS